MRATMQSQDRLERTAVAHRKNGIAKTSARVQKQRLAGGAPRVIAMDQRKETVIELTKRIGSVGPTHIEQPADGCAVRELLNGVRIPAGSVPRLASQPFPQPFIRPHAGRTRPKRLEAREKVNFRKSA